MGGASLSWRRCATPRQRGRLDGPARLRGQKDMMLHQETLQTGQDLSRPQGFRVKASDVTDYANERPQ